MRSKAVAAKTEMGTLMGQLTGVGTELKGDVGAVRAALLAATTELNSNVSIMRAELRHAIRAAGAGYS